MTNKIKIIIILIIFYIIFNNLIKNPIKNKFILAHRGYSENKNEENSIKSVKEAIKKKFKGVELDIFYDNSIKDFVVTHDKYDDPLLFPILEDILELNIPKILYFG